MPFQIPGSLPINGRRCNRVTGSYGGVGRLRYMDPETMQVYEVLCVECVHRGPHFCWCKYRGQEDPVSIKVMNNGHPALFEGQSTLCRITRVEGLISVAEESWPITEIPREQQRRETGVVADVKQGYGFVRNEKGEDLFAHSSEFRSGAQLFLGARVSYRRIWTVKGFKASDIRPA